VSGPFQIIVVVVAYLTLVYTETSAGQELLTASEGCEAMALYDFEGRTRRELTFKKGDVITLFRRKSVDWWEGSLSGKTGLVPDKYLKIIPSSKKLPSSRRRR